MSSKSQYKIIHKLFVLALLLVALVIAGNQIYNYSQFRTTIVHSSESMESFSYPSISFCPGFHDHRRPDFPWLLPRKRMDYFRTVENFPMTKLAAKRLWEETTFDSKDFLKWVEITFENETVVTMQSGEDGACLEVAQLDTMSGRCYTLTLNCSSQAIVTYWNFAFDLDSVNSSNIFLHLHERPEGAIFGLNLNFWYLDSAGETVTARSVVDLPIKRWIQRSRTGVDTIDDYIKCERETYSKNLNISLACWAPMFDAALSYATFGTNHTFRPCMTYQGFAYTHHLITKAMSSLGEDDRCTRPKAEISFETDLKENLAPILGFTDKEGMTCVCIYYDSGELFVEEEYQLINLSSLMSSIGGIIGVILGWSFLHLVNFCLNKFYNNN